ncbi:MAG TPA: hypothetical protein VH186_22460 [Chloroflexia bacterium]|nr:hypothetical protein [Chloroflexia bacterium]
MYDNDVTLEPNNADQEEIKTVARVWNSKLQKWEEIPFNQKMQAEWEQLKSLQSEYGQEQERQLKRLKKNPA